MKSLRILILVALSCAAIVPMGTVSAASKPDSATTTDIQGDVTYEPARDRLLVPRTKAPNRSQGDISSVDVKHTATQVRVLISYVELNRVGTDHEHLAQIKTPKRVFNATVRATTGNWRGQAFLSTRTGRTVTCSLSRKINYSANTALIVVPRGCIGKPRWIKAGAAMANTGGANRYSDEGLSATPPGTSLVLGPRLYP